MNKLNVNNLMVSGALTNTSVVGQSGFVAPVLTMTSNFR